MFNVGDFVGKSGSFARGLTAHRQYTITKKAGPFIKVISDNGLETDWLKTGSFYLIRTNSHTHVRYILVCRTPGARIANDVIVMYPTAEMLVIGARDHERAGYTIVSKKKITLPVAR